MNDIYIKARAKINLNLLVDGKREDGYHDIKSVFQKINLYDEIYIKKIEYDDFKLVTNIKQIENRENIIYKAYEELRDIYDIKGIYVNLNKKIPMQSGMAGGSTDCASFILGINRLFNLNLDKNEMITIGKTLGADVTACFYNSAVMAEGIGDIVTKLNTTFKYYILVIKPEICCDTKQMYEMLDMKGELHQQNNSKKIIEAIENNNVQLLANNLYNVFEEVIFEKENIQGLKKELIENGALGSLMTGSGSGVYGIFKDKNMAKLAYNNLKHKYKVYICTSYNSLKEQ